MKKTLLSGVLMIAVTFPFVGSAQVVSGQTMTLSSLKDQIKQLTIQLLEAQIASLQEQIQELVAAQASTTPVEETATAPLSTTGAESFASTGVSQGAAQDEIDLKTAQCSGAHETLIDDQKAEVTNNATYADALDRISTEHKQGDNLAQDALKRFIDRNAATASYQTTKTSLDAHILKDMDAISALCN